MARPIDPQRCAKYIHVLSLWNVTNYINWTEVAIHFVYRELGLTAKQMGKVMYDYALENGEIHEITETRPNWLDWPFHYDLYPQIGSRTLYVETRFLEEVHPDDCTINVVNAHDP